MKFIFKGMLAAVCAATAFTSVIGFTGCEQEEKEIVNAYDIAVKNGFTGTEEEWLLSLKGKDGSDAPELTIDDIYAVAKKNGYEGTYLEFLKEYLSLNVQEDNDTEIIAKNIQSIVSVKCGFSHTVTVGNNWWGGPSRNETEYYSAAGSGVIIDLNETTGEAYFVTNYHVIYDSDADTATHISDSIYLYPYGAFDMFSATTGKDEGGDGLKATYVGGAMDYDIAVLKVGANDLLNGGKAVAATIGNSENVRVGEKVFAVGNPENAGIAVTSGVISVESEYITMRSTDGLNRQVSYRVMRTDTTINPGNSGGGLFNSKGELIGITNAKTVEDSVDNMNYALPITQMHHLWENILDNEGVVKRAMLGVVVQTTGSGTYYDEAGKLCIREEFIVDATTIEPTAAAYEKLKFGDVFQSICIIPAGETEGKTYELTRRYQLNDFLMTVRLGDTVVLKVLRDNVETEVTLVYDQETYFKQYA
ncbi:MAG: trypsin-like serine protease [Clostridiales bacterium]|nr:trypsin-like serine protease [Clostridiales bacterium]